MVELGRAALAVCDLVVSQGADQDFRFRYGQDDGTVTTWVDLTGWSARAQVRPRPGGEVWLSLTTDVVTDAGSGLQVDSDGYVSVVLGHGELEGPEWDARAQQGGVWDLELVSPTGEVTRLVMGAVQVSQDVTRG